MSSSRHEHDDRRQRSRSRSRRYREDYDYDDDYRKRSRSRSRSRSVDRYRRRHRDTRSRSRDHKRRHHTHSRRHRDSRSRTRSRSRSHTSSQRTRKLHTRTRSRSNSRSSHRSYKLAHGQQSPSCSPKRTITKRQENRSSRSQSADSKMPLSEEPTVCSIETDEVEAPKLVEQENSSTQDFSNNTEPDLENLPLPEPQADTSNSNYEYYLEPEEPIDKERIHREMEEKLREALAKEGKVYPPKKPEASHPVFANDGSFLEIFKKMQEAQTSMTAPSTSTSSAATAITLPTVSSTSVPVPSYVSKPTTPALPIVGRRRGGKILKTGLVAKPKAVSGNRDDKDFWSLYLAEVNRYKNNACELDLGNRPLLK